MSDRLTIEQRHNNMSAIRGKDTKPEILVRKFLWARGFRYRLNHPRLPGKPDIVLRKYRTCILVNGCFWHGHEGCKYQCRQTESAAIRNHFRLEAGRQGYRKRIYIHCQRKRDRFEIDFYLGLSKIIIHHK